MRRCSLTIPPSPWWIVVASVAAFSATTTIVDVSAWIVSPDSIVHDQRSLCQLPPSLRRWTHLQLHPEGRGKWNPRKVRQNSKRRQRTESFGNETQLYYIKDEGVEIGDSVSEPRPMEAETKVTAMEPGTIVTGTFGDIMSPTVRDADLLFQDGLVTSETYSLENTYGIANPLDRMAITANGNLQRLFSSYYDTPVVVEVVYCKRQEPPTPAEEGSTATDGGVAAVWDRRVLLKIFGNRTFCTADSIIEVHDREVEGLVESGKVGIGQIFRHFNILPEFSLSAAGPKADGGFWRNYTLESETVTCSIREDFCGSVWELTPGDAIDGCE